MQRTGMLCVLAFFKYVKKYLVDGDKPVFICTPTNLLFVSQTCYSRISVRDTLNQNRIRETRSKIGRYRNDTSEESQCANKTDSERRSKRGPPFLFTAWSLTDAATSIPGIAGNRAGGKTRRRRSETMGSQLGAIPHKY